MWPRPNAAERQTHKGREVKALIAPEDGMKEARMWYPMF
jgi:hypothetical protein